MSRLSSPIEMGGSWSYDGVVKSSIRGMALLGLVPALLFAQSISKPENGFVSPAKYVSSFFGFSLPLPKNALLTLLAQNTRPQSPSRHILFAASGTGQGYPVMMVGADEIGRSGNADPERAVLGFGGRNVDVVQIGGKQFSRGSWQADQIHFFVYVTPSNGYMLFISTAAYDPKVLDEFEHGVLALTFFDPAKAKEYAGTDARPYEGPPLRQ